MSGEEREKRPVMTIGLLTTARIFGSVSSPATSVCASMPACAIRRLRSSSCESLGPCRGAAGRQAQALRGPAGLQLEIRVGAVLGVALGPAGARVLVG